MTAEYYEIETYKGAVKFRLCDGKKSKYQLSVKSPDGYTWHFLYDSKDDALKEILSYAVIDEEDF